MTCVKLITSTETNVEDLFSTFINDDDRMLMVNALLQVIINRHQELSRFALMHCISSSLCFWFWSILRETADSLYHKMIEHNNSHNNHNHHRSTHHLHSTESLESLIALPLTSYNEDGKWVHPTLSISFVLNKSMETPWR